MISLQEFTLRIAKEKWYFENIQDRLIICRGVSYFFQNDVLKHIETEHIRIHNVADIEIINGAIQLYDDFGENIGYVKSKVH